MGRHYKSGEACKEKKCEYQCCCTSRGPQVVHKHEKKKCVIRNGKRLVGPLATTRHDACTEKELSGLNWCPNSDCEQVEKELAKGAGALWTIKGLFDNLVHNLELFKSGKMKNQLLIKYLPSRLQANCGVKTNQDLGDLIKMAKKVYAGLAQLPRTNYVCPSHEYSKYHKICTSILPRIGKVQAKCDPGKAIVLCPNWLRKNLQALRTSHFGTLSPYWVQKWLFMHEALHCFGLGWGKLMDPPVGTKTRHCNKQSIQCIERCWIWFFLDAFAPLGKCRLGIKKYQ